MSDQFVISNDNSIYFSCLESIGNDTIAKSRGFIFKWLNYPLTGLPSWGLGLYKVTNSKQPDKYFYLDARDYNYHNLVVPYIRILFDNNEGKYKIIFPPIIDNWIQNGEVIKVWELFNHTPNTAPLQSYWNNALVVVPSLHSSPRIIWGPVPNYSAAGYRIHWRYGNYGDFGLLSSVGNYIYEFVHEDFHVGRGEIVEYKVEAYNGNTSSGFTNTGSIEVSGLYKNKPNDKNHLNLFYSLNQNYPDPFNPNTIITYIVPEPSLVKIKVYDVLGKEIIVLVDELKEPGKYSVDFDASTLPSGIYFYTMTANTFVTTGKMILTK